MTATTTDLGALRHRLSPLGRQPSPAEVAQAMQSVGQVVTDAMLLDTVEALRRESVGAGPLDALLSLPGVTDVLVNGPSQVYVDRGSGLELTDLVFAADADVRRLAQRLAASVGRRLDDASPFVDTRLADGTRVHAALGCVADPGTCLSLRVPARRSFSLDDFVSSGSMTSSAAQVLAELVARRAAFLVSGGTGSGKTTLLAALLAEVPEVERIVIVEDMRELAPRHPHVLRLEARAPNAEQVGAITLTDLVRQSLRMRPDRLVVGEVRGAEVADLLAALNTGHEGGCGTVHANSAAAVPARLEALASLARMGRETVHAQMASALDAVVHVRRDASGRRRLSEIAVFVRDQATGLLHTESALVFEGGRTRTGPGARALDRLLTRGGSGPGGELTW